MTETADPAAVAVDAPVAADPAAGAAAPGPLAGIPTAQPDNRPVRSLAMLHGVEMSVTVELGRARLLMRDLLALRAGSIVELDRAAGSPVDVMVNGTLLARGEVVVVDDELGVRITEIVGANAEIDA
jgi:flagellar motor switch protein FliN/FliY